MMHRHAFEALDRSLRDIMGTIDPRFRSIPFGNKVIVFGGDFRQILPVVRNGTRCDIVKASFNRSQLWKHVISLKLTKNMRIESLSGHDQVKAKEFAEYLLRIGEGTEQKYA
jgi:ATP-dependent DNA helicase PIF1